MQRAIPRRVQIAAALIVRGSPPSGSTMRLFAARAFSRQLMKKRGWRKSELLSAAMQTAIITSLRSAGVTSSVPEANVKSKFGTVLASR